MLKKSLFLLPLLIALAGTTILGQAIPRKVHYTINVAHQLRLGDYLLPAGKYVLWQAIPNDASVFKLHPETTRNEPIAIVRTTRIRSNDYWEPSKDQMLLRIDESSTSGALPVLRGWNIAGEDGFEIISVVPKKNLLVRVNSAQ